MTTVETSRLLLRRPTTGDAAAFFALLGDADAMRFTRHHPTLRSCRRRLAAFEWERRRVGYAPWAVIRKSDGQIVGWGGVYVDPFDRDWGPELGYAFHPAVWGQGYGTELAIGSLAWSDETLAIPRIVAFAHPDNAASRRVLGKTGFEEVRFVPEMTRLLYSRRRNGPGEDHMTADGFEIRRDDLSGSATCALLALHLAGMHASSPPGHVFALDLSGLQALEVTVWTVWRGDVVVGVGALKELGGSGGELKSMRTHPDHLRRGVAALLLEHLIREATNRGLRRLSLETGSGPVFEPALALYRRRGFVDGGAFSDYERSPFNQFLHLPL